MSLFARRTETRAITDVPWVPFNVGGVYSPNAIDADKALALTAIYAAIRVLADDISTLPLKSYRTVDGVKTEITSPSLVKSPSAVDDLQTWLFKMVSSLASWGNAYGLVTGRDGYGVPVSIEWCDPAQVSVDEQKPFSPVYHIAGRVVSPQDVVHLRWFARAGHVKGLNPIEALRYPIATGLGAMQYKADWFNNGGVPPGTFKNVSKTVDNDAAEIIKQRLVAAIKRHEPIVHGDDWTYESLSLPADTGEVVATMNLTANQVAAAYGVPVTRIGGERSSNQYGNVEADQIAYVTHSLRPWLIRIENFLSALLANNVTVKFDTNELLRTQAAVRWANYLLARQMGAMNVNEIRAAEDLPPIGPEGDSYEPLPRAGIVPDTAHEFDQPAPPEPSTQGDAHA